MLEHFTFSSKQGGANISVVLGYRIGPPQSQSQSNSENNKGRRKRNYVNFLVICGFLFLYFLSISIF